MGTGATYKALPSGFWNNVYAGISITANTPRVFIATVSDPLVNVYANNTIYTSPYNNENWLLDGNSGCYLSGTIEQDYVDNTSGEQLTYPNSALPLTNPWSTIYNQASGMNSQSSPPSKAYQAAATSDNGTFPASVYMPIGLSNCPPPDSDAHVSVIQPNHYSLDLYATITLASGPVLSQNSVTSNFIASFIDLKGSGTGSANGRRASMIPTLAGLIRYGELPPPPATMLIPHALAVTVSPGWLSDVKGPAWPAYTFDTNDGYANCTHCLRMGELLAINQSVSVNSLGLQTPYGLAIATAAQNYGVYVVERGAPNGTNGSGQTTGEFNFQAELDDPDLVNLQCSECLSDLSIILNALEVVTDNSEASPTGGGTAIAPTAPGFSD
jgi:hypothetical protein